MPPTLLAPDRQDTWKPVWVLECASFPQIYATRDVDVPGAGQAYGAIIGTPTITRRISDAFYGLLEVQDVTVELANADGALSGDYHDAPFTLSRYDEATGYLNVEWTGVVSRTVRGRGTFTIEGTNVDLSILETEIPDGAIDRTTFPLAAPEAIGTTPPWLFGNVRNLPLPYVNDDVIESEFDYLLSKGEEAAIALTALRRQARDVAETTSFEISYDELEPYPGEDVVLVNGDMEDWDAGAAVAPNGWTLVGAGATVAKNMTAGQFDEGNASASMTRVGTNCSLQQVISANVTLPLSWWRGRVITLQMRVRDITAASARIRINDGIGTTNSAFHTGGGAFETLTVTRTIDAAATVVEIHGRLDGANSTAQFDDVHVFLKAKSWAEVLRADLYPDYTAIRFYLRQDDASGALYTIVADVHGRQALRNPIHAIRRLLANATYGLGGAVDQASFNAAEKAVCLTYDAAVLLDDPQVYLSFHDPIEDTQFGEPPQTVGEVTNAGGVARDRSGYERHALATISDTDAYTVVAPTPSGGVRDSYIDTAALENASFVIPYDSTRGFDSPDGCSLEIWYYIANTVVTGTFPLCEKRIGTAGPAGTRKTGRWLSHQSSTIQFGVKANGGTTFTVSGALTAGADTQRWIHIVGTAAGGILGLYKDGVLVGSGTYTGDLDIGDGETVVCGASGDGAAYRYSRFAMYDYALTVALVAAHTAAIALDAVEPVTVYDTAIAAFTPTFSYRLVENTGGTLMLDYSGNANHGVYVGGVLLGPGIPGPINTEQGYLLGSTAARFTNNVARYGVETGMTLAGTAGAVAVWYSPAAKRTVAGICEKTVGGVRDTQWGFCQRLGATVPGIGVVRFTLKTSTGTFTVDAPLIRQDRRSWGLFVATWGTGTIEVYKNGALAASGTYTGTPSSGVGDFYIGIQGTAGSGPTRPGNGDIGRVSYDPSHWTAADVSALWTAGTWYNGGIYVDFALTEPRQAIDVLKQLCQLRGIRLGVTATGDITCSVDAAAPTSILIHARDGAGDGERTIVDIRDRQRPRLDDTVKTLVVKYRRDPLTGEWLCRMVRSVTPGVGRKKVIELDTVREHPSADRFACYMAERLKLDETVRVTLHQEARQLEEAHLIQVTDASIGYAGDTLVAQEVEKTLEAIEATCREWSEDQYVYVPSSFPSGAGPG